MRTRYLAAVVVTTLLLLQSGCTMFDSAKEMSRQSMNAFKFRPGNIRDWNADEEDEYGYVGKIGRGDQSREPDPDPWFKRWVMSPKARNIERNLGLE